jgi:hypothetical protein
MSALGDREDMIRDKLDKLELSDKAWWEVYNILVELYQLRDEVYLLKQKLALQVG